MGYTTEFEGTFALSATPTAEVIVAINLLDKEPYPAGPTPWPGYYCQWQLTPDLKGIEWDGGEKFYDYVEWLQAIIDNILKPAGLALSGEVRYQGEDMNDAGVLKVVDGQVVKEEIGIVIADLKAFKDFVLASDYGSELLEEYRRKKGA